MTEFNKKESIILKQKEILGKMVKKTWGSWLKWDPDFLLNQMKKFTWSMMSLMTFSPETTILNILSESEILDEYVTTIFEGIKNTENEKVQNDILEIFDRNQNEDSDKLVENFIYDTAYYFLQNPINIPDSDPAYSSLKKAEKLSKRFTDGQYKIVKQAGLPNSDTIEPENIDIQKLLKLLKEESLSQKEVLLILFRLYWPKILEDKLPNNN